MVAVFRKFLIVGVAAVIVPMLAGEAQHAETSFSFARLSVSSGLRNIMIMIFSEGLLDHRRWDDVEFRAPNAFSQITDDHHVVFRLYLPEQKSRLFL